MLKKHQSLSPLCFFFFNDTATTEIYTLSLHDALPITSTSIARRDARAGPCTGSPCSSRRSEEHTSELQSQFHLVCRLLLEKKTIHADIVTMAKERNTIEYYTISYMT